MTHTNTIEKATGAINASSPHPHTNAAKFPTEQTQRKALLAAVPTPDKATIMSALKVLFDPCSIQERKVFHEDKNKLEFRSESLPEILHWACLLIRIRLTTMLKTLYTTLS